MRIVHIEDFFNPNAGYQVNLLSRLQVAQGHEVFIITSELSKMPNYLTDFFGKENISEKDEEYFQLTRARIIRIPLIAYISGRAIYSSRIFKTVISLKPDVVFVHGVDTLIGIQFILRSNRLNFPIVLDCHMVEMASVNRFREVFRFFYKRVIAPMIVYREIPIIRVMEGDYVEKCLGIPLKNTASLSFGTDTNYFKADNDARLIFRNKHSISNNDFVVVYAGKLDAHKGGMFFADAIRTKLRTKTNRNIVFVIVGAGSGEYGKEVDKLLVASENRILRFPTQPYLRLVEYYQAADIAIFPRQSSLSYFDAQSCGLPVLFEDNEINIMRAVNGNAITFRSGSIDDFRLCIIKLADYDNKIILEMGTAARSYIKENYDYVTISEKFTNILAEAVRSFSTNRGK